MQEIYLLLFLTGLTGGFGHCLGMCGPVVASYSLAIQAKSIIPHLLYNLGRITTYSLLGGIMGFTGSFIRFTEHIEGIQRTVMLIAGIVIILMGISIAGWLPLVSYIENRKITLPIVQKVLNFFSGNIKAGVFYPMGIVLGFLPCGIVYTSLLTSARAGMEAENHLTGILTGGSLMLLFGLGTMPSLLLFGKVVNTIGVKMRGNLYRLSGLITVAMGILFIIRSIRY